MKRIAVTSDDRLKVTSHAGRCRHFWVFEVEEDGLLRKQSLEIAEEQTFHHSHGVDDHPLYAVDVLIAGGMGRGLSARLTKRGIQAVITGETNPDRAVSAFLEGRLEELPPHDHPHDHGHGHHHHHHAHGDGDHPHDHGHGDHPRGERGNQG